MQERSRKARLKVDAAVALAMGMTAFGFASDYWLIRGGHRPYSRMIRDNWKLFLVAALVIGLHVDNRLGRFDPFTALGNITGVHDVGKIVEEIVGGEAL